jgi:hypothetical protein
MFKGSCDSAMLLEVRDLVNKNGEIWRTSANFSYLGGSLDADASNIERKILDSCQGKMVTLEGHWTQNKGYVNFNLTSLSANGKG